MQVRIIPSLETKHLLSRLATIAAKVVANGGVDPVDHLQVPSGFSRLRHSQSESL
jgi:hypothetical protein